MSFHVQIFYNDNPNGIYYAGQILSGRAEVTLTKTKKIRSLYLTVQGKAETSWNETKSYTDHEGKSQTRTVNYSAEETYLNSVTYLVGSEQGPQVELPSGKHTYNFMCALPALLPCSYEGKVGFVRYTTKITLDRPWKFDQTSKAAFTVISHLDLNLDPKYRVPVNTEKSKSLCCGCMSGPLCIKLQLPKNGYAPGEEIAVTLDTTNDTRVNVPRVTYKIVKIAKYHSRLPSHKVKTISEVLVSLKGEGVSKYSKANIEQKIPIPAIPPSLLHNCSIIDIDYEIQIKAVIPGCHRSLTMSMPVTIGTLPILNRPVQPAIGFVDNQFSPMAPAITTQPNPSAPYDDLPPSYEQCMFGTESIRDNSDSQYTMGLQHFAPSYPVYNTKN